MKIAIFFRPCIHQFPASSFWLRDIYSDGSASSWHIIILAQATVV